MKNNYFRCFIKLRLNWTSQNGHSIWQNLLVQIYYSKFHPKTLSSYVANFKPLNSDFLQFEVEFNQTLWNFWWLCWTVSVSAHSNFCSHLPPPPCNASSVSTGIKIFKITTKRLLISVPVVLDGISSFVIAATREMVSADAVASIMQKLTN